MTRRKKTQDNFNLTELISTRNSKRRKPINMDYLLEIEPLTESQKKLFEAYKEGKNIVAHGMAGTGKTMCVLYNALRDVLDERTPYEKIYITRSIVAVRNPGYLPGTLQEKIGVFEDPYKHMINHMFDLNSVVDLDMIYSALKSQKTLEFITTSFIRGTTYDKCIIIVDEFANLNSHELDSIITRVGQDCKIMFSGDASQSDFTKIEEKNGILDFMKILKIMPSFQIIEFGIDDVCRSGLVKEYLTAKHQLNLNL